MFCFLKSDVRAARSVADWALGACRLGVSTRVRQTVQERDLSDIGVNAHRNGEKHVGMLVWLVFFFSRNNIFLS